MRTMRSFCAFSLVAIGILASAKPLRSFDRELDSAIESGLQTLEQPLLRRQDPVPPPIPTPQAVEATPQTASPGGPEHYDGPIIPSTLWTGLSPAAESDKDMFAKSFPNSYFPYIHVIDQVAADKILMESVRRKLYALDVFTDPEFQKEGHLFYLSSKNLHFIFNKYNLKIVTPDTGKTLEGDAFELCGLVVGQGRLELAYCRSKKAPICQPFSYVTPDFPDHEFKASCHIVETIVGSGEMLVSGLQVKGKFIWTVHPQIERFKRIPPDQLKISTSMQDKTITTEPLCLRNDPSCK